MGKLGFEPRLFLYLPRSPRTRKSSYLVVGSERLRFCCFDALSGLRYNYGFDHELSTLILITKDSAYVNSSRHNKTSR